MRRASSPPQGSAESRGAADRLREAENLLNGVQRQQNSGRLDSIAREADRLAAEQRISPIVCATSLSLRTPGTQHRLWPGIVSTSRTTFRSSKSRCATPRAIWLPHSRTPRPSFATRWATWIRTISKRASREARTGSAAATIQTRTPPNPRSPKISVALAARCAMRSALSVPANRSSRIRRPLWTASNA